MYASIEREREFPTRGLPSIPTQPTRKARKLCISLHTEHPLRAPNAEAHQNTNLWSVWDCNGNSATSVSTSTCRLALRRFGGHAAPHLNHITAERDSRHLKRKPELCGPLPVRICHTRPPGSRLGPASPGHVADAEREGLLVPLHAWQRADAACNATLGEARQAIDVCKASRRCPPVEEHSTPLWRALAWDGMWLEVVACWSFCGTLSVQSNRRCVFCLLDGFGWSRAWGGCSKRTDRRLPETSRKLPSRLSSLVCSSFGWHYLSKATCLISERLLWLAGWGRRLLSLLSSLLVALLSLLVLLCVLWLMVIVIISMIMNSWYCYDYNYAQYY